IDIVFTDGEFWIVYREGKTKSDVTICETGTLHKSYRIGRPGLTEYHVVPGISGIVSGNRKIAERLVAKRAAEVSPGQGGYGPVGTRRRGRENVSLPWNREDKSKYKSKEQALQRFGFQHKNLRARVNAL